MGEQNVTIRTATSDGRTLLDLRCEVDITDISEERIRALGEAVMNKLVREAKEAKEAKSGS